MSDLKIEINWQISLARGWRLDTVEDNFYRLTDPTGLVILTSRHMDRILEVEIDWHGDQYWPTLFAELPKGTHLYQPKGVDVPAWACCGCDSEGLLRVCQPEVTAGAAVCKAWLAFHFAKSIAGDVDRIRGFAKSMVPGNNTVH